MLPGERGAVCEAWQKSGGKVRLAEFLNRGGNAAPQFPTLDSGGPAVPVDARLQEARLARARRFLGESAMGIEPGDAGVDQDSDGDMALLESFLRERNMVHDASGRFAPRVGDDIAATKSKRADKVSADAAATGIGNPEDAQRAHWKAFMANATAARTARIMADVTNTRGEHDVSAKYVADAERHENREHGAEAEWHAMRGGSDDATAEAEEYTDDALRADREVAANPDEKPGSATQAPSPGSARYDAASAHVAAEKAHARATDSANNLARHAAARGDDLTRAKAEARAADHRTAMAEHRRRADEHWGRAPEPAGSSARPVAAHGLRIAEAAME